MSPFGSNKKNYCCICGKEVGLVGKITLIDGFTCAECFKEAGLKISNIKNLTVEKAKDSVEYKPINDQKLSQFTVTNKVGDYISIDENHKWWYVGKPKSNPLVYDFDEILNYELNIDGVSVHKSGLGGAIIGDVLFGRVGAIVGGNAAKKQMKWLAKYIFKFHLTINSLTRNKLL